MFRWTLHLSGGPRLIEHAGVAVGDKVYSFKESHDHNMDQIHVHVFNTVSLRWRTLPPVTPGRGEHHLEVPSSCYGHSAVLVEDVIYLWGGCHRYSGGWCNRLYAFDVDTHRWFKPQVSGTVPEVSKYYSACVLGKVMYIHGGITMLTGRTNAIYKLDTSTMVWALINTRRTPPPASYGHFTTVIGTKMYVFGGWGDHYYDYYNTMRVFDTETNCWLNTPSAQLLPERHCGHSVFTYNGELYIFGGYNNTYFNDLWKFNPETFCWMKVEPKGRRPPRMCTMHCCMVGDRIVIFGKRQRDTPEDLYILDLSPRLKMLCKLAVIQHDLEQAGLTHDVRWELAAMTTNSNGH